MMNDTCNDAAEMPQTLADYGATNIGISNCSTPDADPEDLPDLPDAEEAVDPAVLIHSEVIEEFAQLSIDVGGVQYDADGLGFGYRSQPLNVFVDGDVETFTEEMFGFDVTIRAIPSQFRFNYGDSSGDRLLNTPGMDRVDYAELTGQPTDEYIETPTSHVYDETGVFEVNVTTTYTGEYQVEGGPWIPIPGTVTAEADPGESDIWRIRSAPVSGDCEHSSQWGCGEAFDGETPQIFVENGWCEETGRC
ncbi:hypothetical protein GCM10028800_10990 [Nesterenkonia populi]